MYGRPSGGACSCEALPLGHATGGIGRGVGARIDGRAPVRTAQKGK